MPDLGEQLRECFQGRVCLMGLGNVDYGDDGFGSILSEAILGRLKSPGDVTGRHDVINAQTMPERFLNPVSCRGFDHLIFVDAVEFGGAPGSVIFIGSEEMAGRFPQVSTHKISPGLLARWIEAGGTTKAWLLGVQPGSLKPSRGLTKDVQVTFDILEELLCELWIQGNRMEQQAATIMEGANIC
jgi:hydrogenase 3 maturation protease